AGDRRPARRRGRRLHHPRAVAQDHRGELRLAQLAVVLGAARRIAQHVVGLLDADELLGRLGRAAAVGGVGMVLLGKRAVGRADGLAVGIAVDPQQGVIVGTAFGHHAVGRPASILSVAAAHVLTTGRWGLSLQYYGAHSGRSPLRLAHRRNYRNYRNYQSYRSFRRVSLFRG